MLKIKSIYPGGKYKDLAISELVFYDGDQPLVLVSDAPAQQHNNYCLLPESVWQRSLARACAEGDSVYLAAATSWLNPSRQRPGLLNRK